MSGHNDHPPTFAVQRTQQLARLVKRTVEFTQGVNCQRCGGRNSPTAIFCPFCDHDGMVRLSDIGLSAMRHAIWTLGVDAIDAGVNPAGVWALWDVAAGAAASTTTEAS